MNAMVKEQMQGAANEGVGRVEGAYGELSGDGSAQLRGKITQAKGAAQKAYGEIRDRAQDTFARTRDSGGDVYEAAVAYVRENPVLGVAAGVAFGLLLGLALRGGARGDSGS
jgi:uncharacterized protein YjbJ (UPF0337 family)